jgi:hypothetical protein
MSKKMAKFRQKKNQASKEHVTYLPTYIPTKVVGLPSTPKLTTFRSGIGPPMFLLYCSMPKKKKDFKFIREFPKEKTLSHNSAFSYRTCLNPFSFCLFPFLSFGQLPPKKWAQRNFWELFSCQVCTPKFCSSLCNLVEEGALKKHLVNSPLTKGSCKAHIFSDATCLTKLLENYILVFSYVCGRK